MKISVLLNQPASGRALVPLMLMLSAGDAPAQAFVVPTSRYNKAPASRGASFDASSSTTDALLKRTNSKLSQRNLYLDNQASGGGGIGSVTTTTTKRTTKRTTTKDCGHDDLTQEIAEIQVLLGQLQEFLEDPNTPARKRKKIQEAHQSAESSLNVLKTVQLELAAAMMMDENDDDDDDDVTRAEDDDDVTRAEEGDDNDGEAFDILNEDKVEIQSYQYENGDEDQEEYHEKGYGSSDYETNYSWTSWDEFYKQAMEERDEYDDSLYTQREETEVTMTLLPVSSGKSEPHYSDTRDYGPEAGGLVSPLEDKYSPTNLLLQQELGKQVLEYSSSPSQLVTMTSATATNTATMAPHPPNSPPPQSLLDDTLHIHEGFQKSLTLLSTLDIMEQRQQQQEQHQQQAFEDDLFRETPSLLPTTLDTQNNPVSNGVHLPSPKDTATAVGDADKNVVVSVASVDDNSSRPPCVLVKTVSLDQDTASKTEIDDDEAKLSPVVVDHAKESTAAEKQRGPFFVSAASENEKDDEHLATLSTVDLSMATEKEDKPKALTWPTLGKPFPLVVPKASPVSDKASHETETKELHKTEDLPAKGDVAIVQATEMTKGQYSTDDAKKKMRTLLLRPDNTYEFDPTKEPKLGPFVVHNKQPLSVPFFVAEGGTAQGWPRASNLHKPFPARHDGGSHGTVTFSRWEQVGRCMKLCDKGDSGVPPIHSVWGNGAPDHRCTASTRRRGLQTHHRRSSKDQR